MRNKRIYIFSLLLSLSILGLLWIQFLWINNAVKMSAEDLDSDIRKSLAVVAQEMEDNSYCINFSSTTFVPANSALSLTSADQNNTDSIPFSFNYSEDGVESTADYKSLDFPVPIKIQSDLKVLLIVNDSFPDVEKEMPEAYRNLNLGKFDTELLDSLLKTEFSANGIDLPYNYSVYNHTTKSETFASADITYPLNDETSFEQKVFVNSSFYSPHSIYVNFPNKDFIIWKSLWFVILSSIVLLVVLTFLFVSFLKMVYGLKKLNEMRVDFINSMTHEFKTPVSNITLALKALKKEKHNSSEEIRYLEIIEEEKDRLHEGIDLVLTSALIERKQLSLNKQPVKLDEIINRVVSNNELKIRDKKARVNCTFGEGQYELPGDKHHLANVFDNLLNNALKYSDQEVIIGIEAQHKSNEIEIVFKDTGHGIASADLNHIFEKFFRVSTQNRYETDGFGIGLYYVRMIIEAHHGKITVKSTPRQGTTFTIKLPLHQHEHF